MDFAGVAHREVICKHPSNLRLECNIALRLYRTARGIPALCDMLVIGGRGHEGNPRSAVSAIRLAAAHCRSARPLIWPVRSPVIIDKHDHRLNGLSSARSSAMLRMACAASPYAKYADAFRNVTLAWPNSRFSRSSALSFSAVSVKMPASLRLSISAHLTHSGSLRCTADLLYHRSHGSPPRRIIALAIQNHPYRSGPNFK